MRSAYPAKANFRRDIGVRKYVGLAMRQAPADGSLQSALIDRLLTNRTLAEIANEHRCTIAKLEYWVIKLGFPRRIRGRRALRAPTSQQIRLIALFRRFGAVEAARRTGLSRARVYQVISRWGPSTKRSWIRRNAVARRVPKRRATRCHVVAFRLTTTQWRQLLASRINPSERKKMSGFDKARAIVLAHITPQTDPPSVRSKDASTPVQATSGNKITNFIEQKTA